jgi:multidrug efflux system outer membrane protein
MKYLISLIFLSSCMVGPNYKQPKTSTPKVFKEAKEKKNISIKNWWERFDDPVLNKLIQTALKENFDVKIAQERILQYRALYRIAKADLFPQVDANAQAIRTKVSESLVFSPFLGTPYQNFYEAGFDAIWELDFFGKIRREKEAATYAVEVQIEEKKDVELSLLAEVTRLYVDIRYFQTKIALYEKKKEVEEGILNFYKDRFHSGIDSIIAKEIAEANYQNITSEIPLYEEALKQNFYALVSLLGKNPETLSLSSLKKGPIPYVRGKVFAPMPSSLLRRRPDIRRAEKEFARATANIGVAMADLFPSFSLLGNFHQQSTDFNKLFGSKASSWNIGPIVNWPIITFGKIRSNIDEKKSMQKQACFSYQKTVVDAFKDVESAFVAYFKEKQHLYNVDLGLKAKLKQQSHTNDLAKSGIDDFISYLLSKREALDQEDYVIQSQKTLSINLVSIYKALGGGF